MVLYTWFSSWCLTSLETGPENPMALPLQLKTTPILMLFIWHFSTSSSKRHRPCLTPCRLISLHPSSDPRMANSWVVFSNNLKVCMSKNIARTNALIRCPSCHRLCGSYFAVSFLLRTNGRVASWDHPTRFTVSHWSWRSFLLNPSIYIHLPWPFWLCGEILPVFFFQLFQCQNNDETTRKTWGKNTFQGQTLLKLQLHNLKSLRVFFGNFLTSANSKFRPRLFVSSTKELTAQKWPRVGPKQMAAWEKQFNSFKPKLRAYWHFKLFP